MIIASGAQFRNFSAQNEFSFSVGVVNSTSSGISEFGFSGLDSTLTLFSFRDGSIFDINNRYIWSYNPREPLNFSGNIGSGYINYFINSTPICLFSPRVDNSYYDNFYVKTSGSEIDYDFFLHGDIPSFNIFFPKSGVFGQNLTGFIKNLENIPQKSFKIFSGELFNENVDYNIQGLPLFTISGNQSGQIVLRPEFTDDLSITEITPAQTTLFLNTNFGSVQQAISFDLIPAPIYFIDLIVGYAGQTGLLDNFTFGQYYNYELRTIFADPLDVTVLIKNISGHTGQLIFGQFDASGFVSGNASGFVHGFDYITGTLTGLGTSVFDTDYFNELPTGLLFNDYKELQFATGVINYFYKLPLLGANATGKSPEGTLINATGFLDFSSTGFIYGSGSFSENRLVELTGLYFESENISNQLQTITDSGFYTGDYFLDYRKLFWQSNNITGQNINGYGDKIVNITGFSSGVITLEDFGKINLENITTNQQTGTLLVDLVNLNSSLVSGLASENNQLSDKAFFGDEYFYLTGQTGSIGIFFDYPAVKQKITHYSLELDFNTFKYPFNFRLELSANNTSWALIDNRLGGDLFLKNNALNFYEYPKEIILQCNGAPSSLNSFAAYKYARIRITSGDFWPHSFTEQKSSSGIGIKQIKFYSSRDVTINNSELFSTYPVVPNLTGYDRPLDNILSNRSFSGEALYSNDSTLYPAWYAFNENKNLYPYAEISGDVNNEIYLGYSSASGIFDFTGLNVEFENGFAPSRIVVQFSRDGNRYDTIYNNENSEQSVNLSFSTITGCKSLKLIFNNAIFPQTESFWIGVYE